MNYRIVRTRPLKVFGIEGIISTAGDEGCFSHAGAIWQKFQGNGEYDRLEQAAGKQRPAQYGDMFVKDMCTVHGLLNNKQIGDTKFGYLLCALVAPDSRTDGYTAFEVPETTWAVFPMDIPDWDIGAAIERVNRQFYSEWLPTSEYEKADAPEFEMYGGEPGEMGYIEFWMPVVKKK